MEWIKQNTHIDFMGARKVAYVFSGALILISIISFFVRGLNYGIEFAGGTTIQVKFNTSVEAQGIRDALKPIGLKDASIQSVGSQEDMEFLIRTPQSDDTAKDLSVKVTTALKDVFGEKNVEIRQIEMVGSAVSKDIKQKGFLSLFYACIGILIYVWFRFELRFSVGAVLALVHDVTITMGLFSLTGKEVNLTIVAAVLTIIGYSLNDTIVIFDRVRENMKKSEGKKTDATGLFNDSVNQTLSRTILTNFTVFLVVLCLFFFGGTVIHNFAFAMIIGVIIGTYSTIYIASPLVLLWGGKEENKG